MTHCHDHADSPADERSDDLPVLDRSRGER